MLRSFLRLFDNNTSSKFSSLYRSNGREKSLVIIALPFTNPFGFLKSFVFIYFLNLVWTSYHGQQTLYLLLPGLGPLHREHQLQVYWSHKIRACPQSNTPPSTSLLLPQLPCNRCLRRHSNMSSSSSRHTLPSIINQHTR